MNTTTTAASRISRAVRHEAGIPLQHAPTAKNATASPKVTTAQVTGRGRA